MADRRERSSVLVVSCTFADEESALGTARRLVEERLVACAQLATAPVRSVYRWQSELHDERETLLVLKTLPERWPRLVDRLTELHAYEVPEILGWEVRSSESYGAWLRSQCEEPTVG